MEVYYIDKFDTLSPNGYNMNTGGGCKYALSDETRLKMSLASKGVKKNPLSVAKTAASNTGKKRTKEQCDYQSRIRKGIRLGDLAYENLKKIRTGVPRSEETKAKISAAQKGMKRHQGVYDNNTKFVLQYTTDGIFVKEWFGTKDPANEYMLSQATISAACRGSIKTAAGFK